MAVAPGEGSNSNESLARRRLRGAIAATALLLALGLVMAFFWPGHTRPLSISKAGWAVASAPPPLPASAPIPTSADEREPLPASVKRYLESTIYPPGTGRLTEAQADLLHPNSRYEDYRRILDTYSSDPNRVVSVRLTTDHYFYTADEVVRLELLLRRGATRIDPISVKASAIREGRAGPEGRRMPVRFRREGDALIAKLDSARFSDHHGPIVVHARIEYERGAFYDESLRFFFTPPAKIPARFNGDIADRLTNGSLRVDVGLDVGQSGYYRLDANLYDRFGNPIGFSSFKGNLERGKRSVPIEFFGLLLRDAGIAGPFVVGEIRGYRFLDGQFPDRERIPDLVGRHWTSAYELGSFSDAEYSSEQKQRMVQLLFEDVANGISIDEPPVPGSASETTTPDPG